MKYLKRFIKFMIILFFISLFLVTGVYVYARIIPKIDINKTGSYYLYDKDNNLYFQGNGTSKWVSLNDISPNIIKATIEIEDKNFYKHHGFDVLRIMKAMYVNLINGEYKQVLPSNLLKIFI